MSVPASQKKDAASSFTVVNFVQVGAKLIGRRR
jgi:hypothetical protein